MVIWVVEFSREGYRSRKIFGLTSISSMKLLYFVNWHNGELSHMLFTKNVLLNWYVLWNWKKRSVDFWHSKFTLKVKFWHFLTTCHYVNSKNTTISYEDIYFLDQNLSNFVSLTLKLDNPYYHNVSNKQLALDLRFWRPYY